jgi:hypothetical protein
VRGRSRFIYLVFSSLLIERPPLGLRAPCRYTEIHPTTALNVHDIYIYTRNNILLYHSRPTVSLYNTRVCVSCTAAGIIYESNGEETVNIVVVVVVVSTAGVCLPFYFLFLSLSDRNEKGLKKKIKKKTRIMHPPAWRKAGAVVCRKRE